MRTIVIEPTFEAWRGRARELLLEGVPPEQVLWSDEAEEPCLFGTEPAPSSPRPPALAGPSLKVSSAFMDLARTTAAHTAASRWGALYRLLWRQTRGGRRDDSRGGNKALIERGGSTGRGAVMQCRWQVKTGIGGAGAARGLMGFGCDEGRQALVIP